MIFATYATFEQMHGRKSTLLELIQQLQRFSRESVLYVCSITGAILKLWERGGWDRRNYDILVDSAFEFIRADWYKVAARLSEPELVFHRRQLLLLMKLAVEHCPEKGLDLLKAPRGFLGTMLLMANDHFHYDLYTAETRKMDEFEKVSRLAAEFVPVNEYAGFRPENRWVRAHLMMSHYPEKLHSHPDFIDIAAEYERLSGVPLPHYEALSFGLFTRSTVNITLEALQTNAWVPAIRPENFNQTAIPSSTIRAFLHEFTATPAWTAASIIASRQANRDFGPNDFTVFRKKPLLTERYGNLPSDVIFIIEQFETGPYWRVNDISTETGDRLRRFWGAIFEAYTNDAIGAVTKDSPAQFLPDPRGESNPGIQVCDGILVEGEALVLMEYKSSMFTARAKYSGDHILLRNEIATKLVRNAAEKKKKGVEQLVDAIKMLFIDKRESIKGLSLTGIKRVYPLLITLDDLGASLLITSLLNYSYAPLLGNVPPLEVEIRPLFCTDIESIEVALSYVDQKPLSSFLQHWLDNDPKLMATLLANVPDGLGKRRNTFLDKQWENLNEQIMTNLFPKEHAEHKKKAMGEKN